MLVTSFAFYPATFACEVSVSIDWALLSVYGSMSQTHRDDAGIVECGDELDCCASLQQSAEELAPTQLCASRGIWCVNCEDGVGASDQLLRIDDARADVGVRPCREQSTRTRVAFHQDIDFTGPQSLHTGGSHGHRRLAGRSLLEGVDCDRHIAGLPNSPCAPPGHATLSRRQGSVVRYLRRCTCSTLGRSRLNRKGRSEPPGRAKVPLHRDGWPRSGALAG